MRHQSRSTRDRRRATANRRAGSLAVTFTKSEAKIVKYSKLNNKPYYTNDSIKPDKEWHAYLGTRTTRPVNGNVGELVADPATPKDKAYQHGQLTAPSHLWAYTVNTSESDIRKGARYQTKLRGNIK